MSGPLAIGDAVIVHHRYRGDRSIDGSRGRVIDLLPGGKVAVLIPEQEWTGSHAIAPVLPAEEVERT